MAVDGCDVLLLAGRLGGRAEVEPVRRLIEGLTRLGHDCRVLCLSAPGDHGLDDLVECPGLGRRWQRPWSVRGLDLEEEPGKARIMHALSSRLAEVALTVSERWRIPYLLDVEEFPRRDFRLRLSRAWSRGLVVPNGELAGALRRDYGIPVEAIHQVHRGVPDPGLSAPPGTREPGRVPVVGAAGPLVANSGFTTFLNAARKVVDRGLDAEFLIAGHGEEEGDLRRKAERLRIAERLTFADDLPVGLSFWQVLDVYCQTSIVPTIGRPLRMAMAGGVPSVTTDVEGLRSLVRDGETGLVVPLGDSSALAEAIIQLLQDRARARILGEAARRSIAPEDHLDREAESLDALYREVVEGGLGRQPSPPASRTRPFVDDPREEDAFPRLSGGA